MCMIFVPICVLPLHRNHRFGGIDHVHVNDQFLLVSSNFHVFTSHQNLRKLGWKYQLIVWEWWIYNGYFKSNGNDVFPFINGINKKTKGNTRFFNPTPRCFCRVFHPPEFPIRRRRFWIPWKWSSTSQGPTPTPTTFFTWGVSSVKSKILCQIYVKVGGLGCHPFEEICLSKSNWMISP